MSKRRAFLEDRFSLLSDQGWKLLGVGGYFAYVEHPFELSSDKIAEMILRDSSILCLPGTMFAPPEMVPATRQLRIAFANIGCEELEILIQRLHKFSLALASTHADK
jgi:aspartate/methionine/tyrosine aminotransferase